MNDEALRLSYLMEEFVKPGPWHAPLQAHQGQAKAYGQRDIPRDTLADFHPGRAGLLCLQHIASRTRTPFLNAMDKLSGEYEALQAAADKLEQLAFDSSKIIFAYTLEPGPLDDEQKELLTKTINELVTTAVNGINDAKLVSLQGIELAFGGTDSEVFNITSENWTIIEEEARRLGEELDKIVAEALLDDTITPEERTAILEYTHGYWTRTKLRNRWRPDAHQKVDRLSPVVCPQVNTTEYPRNAPCRSLRPLFRLHAPAPPLNNGTLPHD